VLVRDALMQPVRKVLSATHFKKVMAPMKPKEGEPQPDEGIMTEYLTPCSPGDPEAMEMSWENVEGKDLLEVSEMSVLRCGCSLTHAQPKLVMTDFMRAIQAVRPTVTEADSASAARTALPEPADLRISQSSSTASSPTRPAWNEPFP
jgi:vacuolar protein-sorting-associated protein 4